MPHNVIVLKQWMELNLIVIQFKISVTSDLIFLKFVRDFFVIHTGDQIVLLHYKIQIIAFVAKE